MKERATQSIGKTLEVTEWGIGTAALGLLYQPVDTDQAIQAVHRAYQDGVRYFDTAPLYGEGVAETRLGLALATLPRSEVVISTKVGYTLVPGGGVTHDYSASAIERSLEASLRRLNTDRVDIVYLHDPDAHYREAMDEAYPVLQRWRAAGTIGAIGVGMNQSAMLTQCAQEGDFDCFLLAGRYTLLDQTAARDLLPVALTKGIRLVVGGVFNSGILTDPWAPEPMFNYAPAPADWVAQARAIASLCADFQVPLKAAALQFALAHPAIASVLTGVRSAAEVDENAAMWEVSIPPSFWSAMQAAGYLAPDLPVPGASAHG